ncbi:hypothetical protein O6H91_01G164000 [Diphasiastrum complanatum]|uniref:Uncharacterized protein n=1 Tax=Diphasiastrum complanatum TaxID=34168 RepID=A0ACC2EY74_DIPCM|nr:hypothetical protein O6H91_01G164000 [Diphasiastrum complanatum]
MTCSSSNFLLSNVVSCDDSTAIAAAAGSSRGGRLERQMADLSLISISEDHGGLQIGSPLEKESFIYSTEEKMQAVQRVLFMDDESLRVSEGLQDLRIDSPFPNISDLIFATPDALPDESCAQLQWLQEKFKSTYCSNSFQVPRADLQIQIKDASLGPALPTSLHEEAKSDIPMEVKKGSGRNLGERERRKEINNLICTLQAFLPQRIAKMDKATVLSESLEYIKGLQKKLSDLQKRKAKTVEVASDLNHCPNQGVETTRMMKPCSGTSYAQTFNSKNVSTETALIHRRVRIDSSLTTNRGYFQQFSTNNMSVNVSGDIVYFYLKCRRDVVLEEIMRLLQRQHLDIVRVEIRMNDSRSKELSIEAKATRAEVLLTSLVYSTQTVGGRTFTRVKPSSRIWAIQ